MDLCEAKRDGGQRDRVLECEKKKDNRKSARNDKAGQEGHNVKMRQRWSKLSAEYKKKKNKVTERERCDNWRVNLERQRAKKERTEEQS